MADDSDICLSERTYRIPASIPTSEQKQSGTVVPEI